MQPKWLRLLADIHIIGFRNILAHGYDIVDHSRVLQVALRDVPTLLREVAVLLKE